MNEQRQQRWQADEELAGLLKRYYTGEAGLWDEIRARVDRRVRESGDRTGAYHLRFRRTQTGYEVIIEDATAFHN